MPIAMNDLDSVAGMTVNERLAHFGLLQAFDTAVESRQLSEVVRKLRLQFLPTRVSMACGSVVSSNPAVKRDVPQAARPLPLRYTFQ